jgi:hypothetical protein
MANGMIIGYFVGGSQDLTKRTLPEVQEVLDFPKFNPALDQFNVGIERYVRHYQYGNAHIYFYEGDRN